MSALHKPSPHESAVEHVTGRAVYTDDLTPAGCLHGVVVRSPTAAGRLLGIETGAAAALPGVRAVLTAADVPGDPLVGPIVHDEAVLATGAVHYLGQPVAVVFAETREQARVAAEAVVVSIEETPPVLGIDAAVEAGAFHTAPHVIARGDVDAALQAAAVVVEGEVRVPGQDHFYLETHAALAIPGEGGTLRLLSSTQHPTECQRMAAHVLGIPEALVVCEVPRMGGGFGGKESQATTPACLAALGAHTTGRPTKIWYERHEDMAMTGGRHPFLGRYRAGFAPDGRLLVLDAKLYSDGGWTADLSGPVMDRALFHLDNSYFLETLRFEGRVCATNQPSNTAFRGFGGPQGLVVVEDAIRRGAQALGIQPEVVRRASYYGPGRDRAPYGQEVPLPRIAAMHDRLLVDAELATRRADNDTFNAGSAHKKRGIGHMPLKFGISFTNSLLNQAGALVLVYADGSVQLNNGGTEMGQGLFTKMLAVCADALGVPVDRVRQMRTSTEKVPNTSPTAASSGSDLNGAAVAAACATLRGRMAPVAAGMLGWEGDPGALVFADNSVQSPAGASVPFRAVAKQCWLQRVSLSSTGFYATPGIAYDTEAGRGTPFFYYAYGVALVEVELCGLTGEQRVRRVDILHDVGNSLVPSIDRGQIEGGFVQGLGWLTDEQVLIGPHGGVTTLGPSTYKVPSVGDVPLDFRVDLLERADQPGVIGGSKAVGEPPFMLAIAAVEALEAAVSAFGTHPFSLQLPAHPENLLRAVVQATGGTPDTA